MSIDSMKDKNVVQHLKSYTTKKVLEKLGELSKNLPKII